MIIQRICVTAIITIAYLFLCVPGIAQEDSSPNIASDGALGGVAKMMSGELSSRKITKPKSDELDRPAAPQFMAALYNERNRSWSLLAKVIQIKDVLIYGRSGTIARVEYLGDGEPEHAWIVLRIEDYYFSEGYESLDINKVIALEVFGDYVTSQGIDWNSCPPGDKYCEYASFIEGGFPESQDFNGLMMCPSNLLIYSGHMPDDWINGLLAWRIRPLQ